MGLLRADDLYPLSQFDPVPPAIGIAPGDRGGP